MRNDEGPTYRGDPCRCLGRRVGHNGQRRVRFRKGGFSVYLTGIPWLEDFMRQYAAAFDGVKAQTNNIGQERTIPHTLGALVNNVGVTTYASLNYSFPPRNDVAIGQLAQANASYQQSILNVTEL